MASRHTFKRAKAFDNEDEPGSVSLVVAGLVVIVSLLTIGLARVGFAAIESGRVQAAADAVALAGVRGGRDLADRVADAHDVRVVEWDPSTRALELVVARSSGFEARARAEFADVREPVTIEWWEPSSGT